MDEITTFRAKKLISTELAALGLPALRLTARTIGFQDLARVDRIFVRVHNWTPDPKAEDLCAIGHANGFSVEFR